jgi:chromosome partitioning protein
MASQSTSAARVCITNAKGGTGKTTIAINIAGALNERGRDVLFVDVDPQGNATEGLGLLDAYDAPPPTFFDVLTDHEQRETVTDLIVEHEEMDVIPANIDLLHAEHELTLADVMAKLTRDGRNDEALAALESLSINVTREGVAGPHALDTVGKALSHVEDAYDYILIDSPPFYGKLTEASIYAAGNVLVPALTEATSERAIELLIEQISALEDRTGTTVDTVGVVANRVETTNEDTMMIEWLQEVFADQPVWEVRKRVALQRAFSAGKSIFAYDQGVDMEDVFLDMATEFDRQFGMTEVTA